MDPAVCPQCGSPNAAEANFCSVCGAALVRPDHEHTATHPVVEVADDDQPLLVVIRGTNAGSRFALDQPVTTIGRHPESTVFLDDVTVSRRHAEVRADGDRFVLSDVGSLNGTYVNGDRVDEAQLAEGDQLQVGKYRLVFAFGARDGDH
ncbi:MAG: FHA domain-containing protein [Acidimicrobiales bacterium]